MRTLRIFKKDNETTSFSVRRWAIVATGVLILFGVLYATWVLNDDSFWLRRQYAFLPTSEKIGRGGFGHDNIHIRIEPSGKVSIMKTPFTLPELSAVLRKAIADSGGRQIPLLLIADAATDWSALQPVIRTIGTNGFYKVSFAVRDNDGLPCRSPQVFVPGVSPLKIQEDISWVVVRLTEADSAAELTHLTSVLEAVRKSGSDYAPIAVGCSFDVTMQTLTKTIDVLETVKRRGLSCDASLIVEEELLKQLEANQLSETMPRKLGKPQQ